jgi:hypothetical protein
MNSFYVFTQAAQDAAEPKDETQLETATPQVVEVQVA